MYEDYDEWSELEDEAPWHPTSSPVERNSLISG